MRLLDDDDCVLGHVIAGLEEREDRIWRILFEAVVSLAPEVDEVAGCYVSNDPLRAIGEVQVDGVIPFKVRVVPSLVMPCAVCTNRTVRPRAARSSVCRSSRPSYFRLGEGVHASVTDAHGESLIRMG